MGTEDRDLNHPQQTHSKQTNSFKTNKQFNEDFMPSSEYFVEGLHL
jgi:hypothetical protein